MSAQGFVHGAARALARFAQHPVHSWLGIPCRIYVGVVFIMAAWHKALYPEVFAMSVAAYQVLPLQYINAMAIILPWFELVAAVTLISGLWTRASAWCMVGMNVMFIIALIMAIRAGTQMSSCGCFAAEAEEAMKSIGWDYVYRDIGYLVPSLYVALFDGGRIGMDGLFAARRRRHAETSA